MIDWKEVARDYRESLLSTKEVVAHLRKQAAAEHEKRVVLVNAMNELLPKIASGCHRMCMDDCPYRKALRAVAKAGRSVSDDV